MTYFGRMIALISALAAGCLSGFGQPAEQPVVLVIETENAVAYRGDTNDVNLIARDPRATTPGPSKAFTNLNFVTDIVAINGKPAKGLLHERASPALLGRISAQPGQGQAIADVD